MFLDSSYLRFPSHQTLQVLPSKWDKEVLRCASHADFLGTPKFDNKLIGYSDVEIQKIKRSYDWMKARQDMTNQRRNFANYFRAHDERRGTDFAKTFPELADFFEYCKTLS